MWADLTNDARVFFASAGAGIHPDATLNMVKFAAIGADGKYTKAPVERAPSGARIGAGGGTGSVRPANQVALAVTLLTAGDLGRVKGRFYVPVPAFAVTAEGRYSVAAAQGVATAAQTFLNAVNNQPGLDVLGLQAVVASQGRRNKDGSVRTPARNHVVTGVKVGRTPDTIRTRRNKVSEAYGASLAVT